MIRKIFALLALVGLAAAPSWAASNSSGPIEGCAGSYNAEDKVFTASGLSYVALTKNDDNNRNTTGWYTGLTISWDNQVAQAKNVKAEVATSGNLHNVSSYTTGKSSGLSIVDNSPAGSGIKFTLQTKGITYYLKTCEWWVCITAEDAYELNGADYEATLTVADEAFKIVIPASVYNAGLKDSDNIQWFPAVALIGTKVYGDIDVALNAAGDVGMVAEAAVKSAHTLGQGAILRKNGKALSFEGDGSITATLGAKFDFEPTELYDAATYKVNGPDEDGLYTIAYNHVCDWQYAGDGTAALTAMCQTGSGCPYGETLTVSLNAEAETAYSGSAVSAAKNVPEKFTEATGLTVGEITYWQGGAQLAGAPKYKGSYEARLTVGSYTLKKAFAITHTGDWADGYSVVSTDVRYDTIGEALAAAANGDTVKCWADDSKFTGFTADIGTKNVTLDLNGKTLSRDDNTAMTLTVNGTGTLTIKNGTIAQPYKSNTSRNHLTIASGNVVFGEGLTLVNKYTGTTASNRFKVTAANGSSLSISNGLYKCNFTANNNNIEIAGGQFWQYFDPTSMLAAGHIVRELKEGDYKYEVVEKPAIVDLKDASFSLSETSVNFDGTTKSVTETVTYGGDTLVRGTHYTITEDKLSGMGSAESNTTNIVVITAIAESGYTGSATNKWTIVAPTGEFDADSLSTSAPGCTASGDAVTVTESTALDYDSAKKVWTVSMTITWPIKTTDAGLGRSGTAQCTDPQYARVQVGESVYTGVQVVAGDAAGIGLSGVSKNGSYETSSILGQTVNYTYLDTVTYTVALTPAIIEAAKAEGSLSFPVTVYGLAWGDETLGNPSGLKPTTFKIVVPIDEKLVLNDENGDEVYPNPHKHMWGDCKKTADNVLAASCTNESTECSVEGRTITLTLKAEDQVYTGDAPTVSLDGKDDFEKYFKERVTIGEITYTRPAYCGTDKWYAGAYTANRTVTIGEEPYPLTKSFNILPTEYTDGFVASVGGLSVRFNTLAEAVGAVEPGATIFWKGGNRTAAEHTFSSGKDITLDLGGATLTYNQNAVMTIKNNGAGKVTFVNGTIKQPKGSVNANHITLKGENGGSMAFGEGITFVNQASNDNNYLTVTADGIAVEITGGQYKAGFAAKNGGSLVIKGGDFWENDNPSEFLVEGFAIGQSTVEGYRYRVIAHTHALVYAVNGNVITLTCTGTPNTAECFYNKADVKLTLVADDAKEDKDGKPYAAKLGIHDAFEPKVTADAITYWQGGAQLAVAPSAIGEYEARITVEDVTAVKAFRILDRARTFDVSKISVTGAGDAACYELAGTTLTVTNGGWKYYSAENAPDGSKIEGWYAGLTVTWPNDLKIEGVPLSAFNFTGPEFAKFTMNDTEYSGEKIAVKTSGFDLAELELTQVTSFIWYERITVPDVRDATKAGQDTIERKVAAKGEKWQKTGRVLLEHDYGDTDGVSNTTFTIIADLKDLELWDNSGHKIWPSHPHEWEYAANENSITARCTIVEKPCIYHDDPVWAKLVPTDKAEKLCDATPLTAWVENGVTFAGATDATVGEVEYWQGGRKLDDAPTQPGVYTAKAIVTIAAAEDGGSTGGDAAGGSGSTEYTLKTTLTIRAGQVVVDGQHYEKAESQLERTYLPVPITEKNFKEPLYISLGKDFAAERAYVIPDAPLDLSGDKSMKTLDLAGFTVTGAVNAAVIDNKGKLTIRDSSEAGTGTLRPDQASDPATPLLINEKGATLMIDGGTYLGPITNRQGTVVITSGRFLYEPDEDWLDDGSYVRQETVGGQRLYVVYPHVHNYTFLQLGSLLSATCTARDQGQGLFEGSSCKAKEVLMVVTMASKDFDGKPMYEVKESGGSWLDDLKDMIGSWIGGSGIQNLNPYVNYVNVTSLVGSMGITEFLQGLSGGIDGLLKELFETKKETFLTQAKFESMTGAEIKDIYFTQEPDGSWFSQLIGLTKEARLDEPPTNAGTYNFCVDVEAKRLIGSSERIYTLKQQFKINARPIADTTVALTPNSTNLTYTGHDQAYAVKVQTPSTWGIIDIFGIGKTTLVEGEDYTISGTTNATVVGSYSFTVTGIGNYTGSQTVNWQISAPTREFDAKAVGPTPSARGTYAAADGMVVTVNNASNLTYDVEADAWNLGLVVTWPDGSKRHTLPADAWVKLSTQKGATYTGADILDGQTDGEDLTLEKTGDYVKSVTWKVQLTTNDVEAAIAAGESEIVLTLTAGANASATDPQGVKETAFQLVIPVAGIRLYDNGGKRIYPEHLHDWSFVQSNEDELTVTCVSEEPGCSVPEEGFTLVLRPISEDLEYDGSPKVCVVDQPDGFAPLVGALVGEVAYSQAGVPLAGAPSLRGEYVATATVSYGGKTYTLTKNFEILRPEGGYVDGFEVWSTHDRYETLVEAIAAARAEDTIVCCAGNASFTSLTVDLGGKDLTLDLNGKTWSNSMGEMTLASTGGGTLTLANGTIRQPTSRAVVILTTYHHLTVTAGDVVFGEGLKLASQWTSSSNRTRQFTVTANAGSALKIVDGGYQCNFVATGDNLVISGGRFWSNFNPSDFLAEEHFVYELTQGDYRYEVAPHRHNLVYSASGTTIFCACNGDGSEVCPIDGENCYVRLVAADALYTGSAYEAVVESGSVDFPSDFTVEYAVRGGQPLDAAPVDAGRYTAYLSAGGKRVSADFEIGKVTIDQIEFAGTYEFEYDGTEKSVTLAPVTAGDGAFTLDEQDYTVVGTTCSVGKYYRTLEYPVVVTGTGNFSGSQTSVWRIVVSETVPGFYLPQDDYELIAGVPVGEIPGEFVSMGEGCTVTAKNLPTGISLKNRTVNGVKEYYLTGTPTKAWDGDAKPTTFTAKDKGDYKKTGAETAVRFFVTLPEVAITTSGSADGCKVTGTGSYAANKKVTLKATAAKGKVFAGWYEAGSPVEIEGVDYRNPSLSLVVPETGIDYEAHFVDLCDDYCGEILVPLNADGVPEGELTVDSISLPTVTVSGLPAGVTFDKKTSVFTVDPKKFKGASAAVTVSVKNAGGYQNAVVIAEPDDIGDSLAVGQIVDEPLDGWFTDVTGKDTLAASGLPTGLKLVKVQARVDGTVVSRYVLQGLLTKAGRFTVKWTYTRYADQGGKLVKDTANSGTEQTVMVVQGAPSRYVALPTVVDESGTTGSKLTGGGVVVAAGASVKTGASAAKNAVFAGWYDGDSAEANNLYQAFLGKDGDYRIAAQTWIHGTLHGEPTLPETLVGRFVAKTDDVLAPEDVEVREVSDSGEALDDVGDIWNVLIDEGETHALLDGACRQVAVAVPASLSVPKVTVKGLPSGLTSKVYGSTAVFSYDPAGKSLPKPGEYTVTLTVQNQSSSKAVRTLLVRVPNVIAPGILDELDSSAEGYVLPVGTAIEPFAAADFLTMEAVENYSAKIKSVSGLPSGLSYKNGQITGTPKKAGLSVVTVTATYVDGQNDKGKDIVVTVTATAFFRVQP